MVVSPRGQVDNPTPKRKNINTETVLGTPNVQANNADVEHTACDLQDCIYCIEYGPNMEELAADLWNPNGGIIYPPGQQTTITPLAIRFRM